MAGNHNLIHARVVKKDEFYTRYEDIEAEINAYYEYDHDVFRGKTILCPCDDHEWSNCCELPEIRIEETHLYILLQKCRK